jgi:transposase
MFEEQSIRAIARERGVHRRTVRQALSSAIPPQRKGPKRDRPVLTEALRGVVDEWLIADQKAPRKQRHTARRIFVRLRAEHGYRGAESSVRAYVGRRRRELGLGKREVFVPLMHLPGQEAEVDWYETHADLPTGRRKYYVLCMRACYSGREFHVAFAQQTQQAFLEGLALSFEHFGGVFARVRFDNLGSAVKKVLKGRSREETDRFVALRSHYLFESEFCQVGLAGAHEKGGVEGAAGRFRRSHLAPVPAVGSLAELNMLLLAGCAEDAQRVISGRTQRVLDQWLEEKDHLRSLPKERFPTAQVLSARVDDKSRVHAGANRYSVPTELVGRSVEVQLFARTVRIVHAGAVVAEHERLVGRGGESLRLDHYLELLRLKPAAMGQSVPLQQARAAGAWPAAYDRLWEQLRQRHGEAAGTRQMIDVLILHRKIESAEVHAAVAHALELGCCDAEAVELLLRQRRSAPGGVYSLEPLGQLDLYGGPPSSDLSPYDALLGQDQEEEAA